MTSLRKISSKHNDPALAESHAVLAIAGSNSQKMSGCEKMMRIEICLLTSDFKYDILSAQRGQMSARLKIAIL
jgi:hypothetical protein